MTTPAIFLDRDGVIIENRSNYIRSWNDVYIFPEAVAALSKAAVLPHKFIIITNQSCVGRGLVPLKTVKEINHRLVQEIEKIGGRVDGVYICPHAPEAGCTCRKPEPGMILQAAEKHDIDLTHSVLIGDAVTDYAAGRAAGVGQLILVLTGRGQDQLKLVPQQDLPIIDIYPSLGDAINGLFFDNAS